MQVFLRSIHPIRCQLGAEQATVTALTPGYELLPLCGFTM